MVLPTKVLNRSEVALIPRITGSVHLSLDAVFGIFVPFDKPLHDRGVGTGFPLALGAAVRFIDNKVQSARFVLNGIIKGFPNRVLPVIRVLRQFTVSADFLSIQKVDMTIFQHLHIKSVVADDNALV